MKSSNTLSLKLFSALLITIALLQSISSFAQQATIKIHRSDEYNFVQLGNHTLQFSAPGFDTIEIEDVDGTMVKKIVARDSFPEKLDGKVIYGEYPIFKSKSWPGEYLLRKIKKDAALLEDGFYVFNVRHVIVDETGKTVSFNYYPMFSYKGDPMKNDSNMKKSLKIDKKLEEKLFNSICNELANFPKWTPAKVGGKPVVSISELFDPSAIYQFKVQKHKVYFFKNKKWLAL